MRGSQGEKHTWRVMERQQALERQPEALALRQRQLAYPKLSKATGSGLDGCHS